MKLSIATVVILGLVATSALAVNCADHPWAKRNQVQKILKGKLFDGWTEGAADLDAVINVFKSDSTATDATALAAGTHPKVPSDWITSDSTTCCTVDIYNKILAIPGHIIKLIQSRPSKFERLLGGFPRVVKACGIKKKKDGEAGPEIDKMTVRSLLKKLPGGEPPKDGEEKPSYASSIASDEAQSDLDKKEFKSAIELVKIFYQGKAITFSQWIDLQRGNLLFLCRRPDLAKQSLQGGTDAGAPKVTPGADTELQAAMKDGFGKIIVTVKKLAGAIKHAFKIFGDSAKCAAASTRYTGALAQSVGKTCGDNADCKAQAFKFRVLDFGILRALTTKAKGSDDEGTGNLDDKGDASVPSSTNAPPASPSVRRVLNDDESQDAVVADANDNSAIGNVTDPNQTVTFGGVDKDGNCTGNTCDYSAADTQYNENLDLTAGGITPNETSTDADDTTSEASANLLTAAIALLALISFL